MQQLLSHYRTMFLFRGLAAIAFGIIALVWPKLTLRARMRQKKALRSFPTKGWF